MGFQSSGYIAITDHYCTNIDLKLILNSLNQTISFNVMLVF